MKASEFKYGMRDGIPIGLGYLAVSFSLGIFAAEGGLGALQGFFASLFTLASAGEYAGFTVIAEKGPYIEMALVILVANCRYLLMSCAMSQRLDPDMKKVHRIFMGAFITDEIFGASIAREGCLKPEYTYGLAAASALPWAIGTALGIAVGNLVPENIASAMSVALYGMFLAIIIPPARRSKAVLVAVLASFAASWASNLLFPSMSSGLRIVIVTVAIASLAAVLFPVEEKE